MDHRRACFSLLKHEAAVWTTYDGHGELLGESVPTQRALLTAVQSWWWRPCGRCVVSIARLTSISRRASSRRGHTEPWEMNMCIASNRTPPQPPPLNCLVTTAVVWGTFCWEGLPL
jgi:hypothetical protein